jgi:hypothetical protein
MYPFRNNASFYGEELLAPRPIPKLEDHPLSIVRDCLFHLLAATLYTGSRSSMRNLRTRHVVVTGTHLSWTAIHLHILYSDNTDKIMTIRLTKAQQTKQ